VEDLYGKLRLHIRDGSYLDVWFSRRIPGRYAYHWERRHIDGKIYRHDNRPHVEMRHMASFPRHFHDGRDEVVAESPLGDNPVEDVRRFLSFIRSKLEE
jgi:hypothetical protein